MDSASALDRTVATALAMPLTQLLDPVFLDCSYGFRSGKSTWHMLAQMAAMAARHDRWVVVVDDIRDAFGNVVIADVMEDFRQHVDCPRLLWLIETVLRGGSNRGREKGIEQGNPFSPLTMYRNVSDGQAASQQAQCLL